VTDPIGLRLDLRLGLGLAIRLDLEINRINPDRDDA